ncbi:MAG TPA: hypothetical protein D7H95_06560 [Candidatus Poseidoniales archaeon]|nr:MAG TPA: hypothetical protein D7H95_06560 [Candidatus Poseidoniales archaeon]
MSHFQAKLNRMIETSCAPRRGMDEMPFPHFVWQSAEPKKGSAMTKLFLEHRPNERWVLVGEGVAQCHAQLWTAWNSAARRQRRNNSLARSFDAEFLRYLSGTHHVSEAFKRAGVRNGDCSGCFLVLPAWEGAETSLPTTSGEEMLSITQQADSLAASLEAVLVGDPLECNIAGAERLGLSLDGSSGLNCDVLVGHVVSAEFNS